MPFIVIPSSLQFVMSMPERSHPESCAPDRSTIVMSAPLAVDAVEVHQGAGAALYVAFRHGSAEPAPIYPTSADVLFRNAYFLVHKNTSVKTTTGGYP